MLWGFLIDGLLIVSIMVWVLGLAFRGVLGTDTAALALLALVALAAIGRSIGGGLVRLTFRLALPAASLFTFALVYGQGQLFVLVGYLAVLLFVLFGFYLMIRGAFPRRP